MNRLRTFLFGSLCLALLPTSLLATGIEYPLRWITQENRERPPILQPPQFYFEVEMRRIAGELKVPAKALPPAKGSEGERDFDAQVEQVDLADFQAAIAAKRIQPPDIEAAVKAHEAMRDLIQGTSEEKGMPESIPKEFDSEFTDYHRGALAHAAGKKDEAKAAWVALLARPEAARRDRTSWALYMLGRAAIDAQAWDEARGWFGKLRAAIEAGFADSLGLYSAGLGWEGYAGLHSGKLGEAAHLYLQQLATGDVTAVNSLRVVLGEAFKEDSDLAVAARDPWLQRIGIAGAVAEMTPFMAFFDNEPAESLTRRWLKALEEIGARNVRDADRVAWTAYSHGQYADAQRWLARADANAPYTAWLRAKFALREGKLDVATKLLAQAVEHLPLDRRVEAYSLSYDYLPAHDVARGELGLLKLNRSDFLTAMRLFLEAALYSDAFYVADGILTVEELKKFVDGEATKLPKIADGEEDPAWHFYYYRDPQAELRGILARRFIRLGRYQEARPYLKEELQTELDAFVAALGRAQAKDTSKEDKAEAFWTAAQSMAEHGSDFADYFDPVSMAQRSSGRVVDTGSHPEFYLKYGGPDRFAPPLSRTEQQRLKANSKPDLRRLYSSFVAADLAWQSAALLPDNDDRTAERLNAAGLWIKEGDDKRADRFYEALIRRCPKTKVGSDAIKRRWFVSGSE